MTILLTNSEAVALLSKHLGVPESSILISPGPKPGCDSIPFSLDWEPPQGLAQAIKHGDNCVASIKEIRRLTQWGLADAKRYFDHHRYGS